MVKLKRWSLWENAANRRLNAARYGCVLAIRRFAHARLRCETMQRQCKKAIRLARIASMIAAGAALWCGLLFWSSLIEGQAHYQPAYEKVSLEPILRKMAQAEQQAEEPSEQGRAANGEGYADANALGKDIVSTTGVAGSGALTVQDYETLFYQTGLGPAAVDQLCAEGRQTELLQYQNDFFREVTVKCERYNAFVSGEYLVELRKVDNIEKNGDKEANRKRSGDGEYEKIKGPQLAPLREGDILITPCSHCYGWRNGHAAIVVEAPGPTVGALAKEISDPTAKETSDPTAVETLARGTSGPHAEEDTGGWTLESVTLGVNSRLRRPERWRSLPAFAVLRLREDVILEQNQRSCADQEAEPAAGQYREAGAGKPASGVSGNSALVGAQAAALARDYFCGVPYRLSAGLWGEPWELPEEDETSESKDMMCEAESMTNGNKNSTYSDGKVTGTQCAHMIWSCYRALGYDLDSDGGRLVTPRDLLESPLLEVVQIYGMDPEDFWQGSNGQ